MIWLTNLCYCLVVLVAAPYLAWRSLRTGRYREGWKEKLLGLVPKLDGQSPVLWLHGVSVGEIQLLNPLAQRLAIEFPNHRIVFSTTTQTGMHLARKLFPANVVFYMPLDFSWSVRRALARIRPELVVLGELELWPNLIRLANLQGVPLAVVNGRLSDNSFRGYRRIARWLRPVLRKISAIGAQDSSYAERFASLGVPRERICVTGSMKFDNLAGSRDCEPIRQLAELVGLSNAQRVVVAGSTQAPEERLAAEAFGLLQGNYPELRLIVVPRHPERFDEVYNLLLSTGARVVRRSHLGKPISSDSWRILLVDTVGELRWWWGVGEIAVVGGSFGSRGGQNMIEPAAYGCNIAFGPNTWNFREVVRSLLERDAAVELSHLDRLVPWLDVQLANPQAGVRRGQRARQVVVEHQGATERTLEMLRDILPSDAQSTIALPIRTQRSAA